MIGADSSIYRLLVWTAFATVFLVVGTVVYQYVFVGDTPGELNYRRGNLRLEDGKFSEALADFDIQLAKDPGNPAAFLGKGLALMGLGAFNEALQAMDAAVDLRPEFAAAYANRGILYDKMGRYEAAIKDYRRSLELDEDMGDGPDWITRFLRSQWERPPSVADRAKYLEEQLQMPVAKRLLRVPELDDSQRSYKFEGIIEGKD